MVKYKCPKIVLLMESLLKVTKVEDVRRKLGFEG